MWVSRSYYYCYWAAISKLRLNIFNMLGYVENGQTFVINNVRVRIAFSFVLENNVYNLTNDNIRYCILEDESLPILTP